MHHHKLRKAAIALAVFLLFTIGYPVAVDQAWFHYNPFVLPIVVLTAACLGIFSFFHSDFAYRKFGAFARLKRLRVAIPVFAGIGHSWVLVLGLDITACYV